MQTERLYFWLETDSHPTEREAVFLGWGLTAGDAQQYLEELEEAGEIEADVFVPVLTNDDLNEMGWLPDSLTAPRAYGVRV